MNFWGWVDFSRRDRDLACDIIASLNEPGAVDELGIGVIRDAFADYFFPGTSTIQTIAKYFFLVSYQLEELTRTPAKNYEQLLRTMEQKASLAMWNSLSQEEKKSGKSGVFGRTFFEHGSHDWVKRPPSIVYWSGIRKLKFWNCSNETLSLADFLRMASTREPIPAENNEDLKGMRKNSADFEKSWHWNLPPVEARGDWLSVPNINLTPGEAAFLVKQIADALPDTMFAFVTCLRNALPKTFSDLAKLNLPVNLKEPWKLANDFSEFIKPAQVRFNFLLKNEEAQSKWNEYSDDRLRSLAGSVDLNAVFTLLDIWKHHQLHTFLENLQEVYRSGDTGAFDQLLLNREKALKGERRMKLGKDNSHYKENWVGGFGLEYRYPDVCRILADVVRGEEVR